MYMTPKSGIVTFEWDEGNIDKSYEKHGVVFKEIEEVFLDESAFVVPDIAHSQKEPRYIIIGCTIGGKRLFVVFTIRKDHVRIVSARRMHAREVVKYETIKKNSSL